MKKDQEGKKKLVLTPELEAQLRAAVEIMFRDGAEMQAEVDDLTPEEWRERKRRLATYDQELRQYIFLRDDINPEMPGALEYARRLRQQDASDKVLTEHAGGNPDWQPTYDPDSVRKKVLERLLALDAPPTKGDYSRITAEVALEEDPDGDQTTARKKVRGYTKRFRPLT